VTLPYRLRNTLLIIAAGVALNACATKPEPLTQAESGAFAADKLARVTLGQEPIRHTITLHEAMARAVKYNLDTKVEVAQAALKLRELDLSDYKMLPSIVANSGFSGRDITSASVSRNLQTGRLGTEGTTSTDREVLSSDLQLSWNILDFGLSYVRAQQLADEALIASEARRKVANRVIEDVRTAYWRAVSFQRLSHRLRGLERRAIAARSNARKLYNDGQTQPTLALSFERELVEIRREIQKVEGDLLASKAQLAALMNVKPGEQFNLADGRSQVVLGLKASPDRLIQTALENRPEMREIHYRTRINKKEATAALLELLPGAQLFIGGNFDSNRFLVNNNWLSYGAKASWNLMKIAAYPARKELLDQQDRLLDQRALAVTMAIMTQVHVSRARYVHAERELRTHADYLNVQNDILAQVRAQAATDKAGEQALIREEMNALLAEVRFDIAHSQLQSAFAGVYSALGLDPIDHTVSLDSSVKALSADIERLWRKRGDSIGNVRANLLRPPRRPKPVAPLQGNAPPLPGQLLPNGQPPLPSQSLIAPAGTRSIGGALLPPRSSVGGDSLTTQSVPAPKAATTPTPAAAQTAPKTEAKATPQQVKEDAPKASASTEPKTETSAE
jgi:outer membrane protein TolC